MKVDRKILLPGLTGLLLAFHIYMYRNYIMDDAFISFRFIQQWVHGHGLVYNVGQRVEGYSNFLWIILLAPFARLGLDLPLAAKALGIVLSFLTLVITWRFSLRISGSGMAPLLLAAMGPFAIWSVAGLETPLYAFLITAAVFVFLREEERGEGVLSGLLYGLLAITRPEGLFFGLVAAAYRGAAILFNRERISTRDLSRLGLMLVVFLPYFVWRWIYYGYPLPNTVYAKTMGLHLLPLLKGLYYIYVTFKATGGFFFLALPVFLALLIRPRPPRVGFLALNLFSYGALVAAGGGDWMPNQRFVVHVLPLMCLLVQEGLEELKRIFSGRPGQVLFYLLFIGQAGYVFTFSMEQDYFYHMGEKPYYEPMQEELLYMKQRVRAGDTVALLQAGYLAYHLPLEVRVVDMVGLVDSHISHLAPHYGEGAISWNFAFGKWDVDYVLAQKPRFVETITLGRAVDNIVTVFQGTTLLVNDPRFKESYRLVNKPPGSIIFERTSQ